jgi:hypothetical protein
MNQPLTDIRAEFLMTLHSPLSPPQIANSTLEIYNALPGGWVKGPRIQGEIIPPTGDWFRRMPNGNGKLDVRMSIRADDGSIIFAAYVGRTVISEVVRRKYAAGEEVGADDAYFIISPTFETTSEKYGWLNDVVAAGKMISLRGGPDSHITYNIFVVR